MPQSAGRHQREQIFYAPTTAPKLKTANMRMTTPKHRDCFDWKTNAGQTLEMIGTEPFLVNTIPTTN